MRKKSLFIILGAAAAVLALIADPPPLSLSKDVQPVLNKECLDCHSAEKHKGKLVLASGEAFKNLVNAPSDEVPAMVRVKPGDPDQSYLWQKLQHKTKEGSGMPKAMFGAKKLPQEQLDLIKHWIEQGARE